MQIHIRDRFSSGRLMLQVSRGTRGGRGATTPEMAHVLTLMLKTPAESLNAILKNLRMEMILNSHFIFYDILFYFILLFCFILFYYYFFL